MGKVGEEWRKFLCRKHKRLTITSTEYDDGRKNTNKTILGNEDFDKTSLNVVNDDNDDDDDDNENDEKDENLVGILSPSCVMILLSSATVR